MHGPFHVAGAPYYEHGADVGKGAKGEPCFVRGRVCNLQGEAIAGAEIDVCQADADDFYDVQRPGLDAAQARGILYSNAEGKFHFKSIVAKPYPIPHDGPVGKMLESLGRHPWRPAHLHFMITAPGYEKLITHVFREGVEYLDSDAVFGVRSSLVADWIRHPAGPSPDGAVSAVPFYSPDFNLVLSRERADQRVSV